MKNIWITMFLTSMALSSCGGSDSGGGNSTEPSKSNVNTLLANTSWIKECSPYNKFTSEELTDDWNVKIKLTIDSSLKSTYKTEYFHPNDSECNSLMFDALDISNLEITGNVTTDESIAANALNETFIYNSDNRDLAPNYTLIYINSEKLYFGQNSADNLGKTIETRHSSISLDDYFTQTTN